MNGLVVGSLMLAVMTQSPDTTLALERGDRVELQNFSGRISVEVWGRPELQVRGADDDEVDVGVERTGSRVALAPRERRSRRYANLVVKVPAWVALRIQGGSVDVDVRGCSGTVDVRTMSGDVRVDDTSGDLDLYSADGEVTVQNARGTITARSESDDVVLRGVRGGEVRAESGSGDVRLVDVDAPSIHAGTLDGEVEFEGPLHPRGTYAFSVHDGDAVLTLPDDADARVTVSTFDGEFTSQFPVTVEGVHGTGRFQFTLGQGEAEVRIEVFDGDIRVQRRR